MELNTDSRLDMKSVLFPSVHLENILNMVGRVVAIVAEVCVIGVKYFSVTDINRAISLIHLIYWRRE
jgi:hypothetical protein